MFKNMKYGSVLVGVLALLIYKSHRQVRAHLIDAC